MSELPPDPDQIAQREQIVWLIRKMVSRIYVDSKAMSKRFGLTGPQALVLRALLLRGPQSSAELSHQLYVTPSNLTGIVDRLEAKGLLTRMRKPKDRRVLLLALSDRGTEHARALPDPLEERLTAGLNAMSLAQVCAVREAFELVVDCMAGRAAPDVTIDPAPPPGG